MESEVGLSPARQTQDPKMIGLEDLAASQDPNLRDRLLAKAAQGEKVAARSVSKMGGDVEATRQFFEARQADFRANLGNKAQEAIGRADEKIKALGPNQTEARNSREIMSEIDSAYNTASMRERELWDDVPMDATAPVSSARQRAQKWKAELGPIGEGNIPQKAKTWLLDQNQTLTDSGSVRDMHQLYSGLRQTARDARSGASPNRTLAMIADDIADGVLEDLGRYDPASPSGRAIAEALAFTAAKHETFSQGAVGRLRKKTPQGETAVDPEMSMQRTVGRQGETAAVGARQIEAATEGRGTFAIQDYIKDRFTKAAISPTGEMTTKSARSFMQNNDALLKQYPALREQIVMSVRNREGAAKLQDRIENVVKASQRKSDSTLSAFIGGPPEKAINSVFTSRKPLEAAKTLRNAASKDKTGAATSGLKGAFVDNIVSATGGRIDGAKLQSQLNDPRMREVLSVVFDKKELLRLDRIASELVSATQRGTDVGSSLSGSTPNKLIEYMVRIGAAKHGAELGGGGGASLQTAQMASSRAKEIMGRLVNDKASDIIADAMEDPELLRSLLTDINRVDIQKDVIPRFLPYMVGGSTQTLGDE